ncbi:MAG TPA: Pr6Pr family membrane protein [Candidatus Saccharimonas sp.]|nr:Pr6Pr family membrane protein [Candidatus Saccharimonas sp.]
MRKDMPLRFYRILFGLLVITAIAAQLQFGMQQSTFSIVNFFSFFTIESNIFAAVLFLVLAFTPSYKSQKWAMIRGASVVFMATTGIVYALLLSGLEESLQTPIPWVNAVLHYIMPAAVLLDWFVDLPAMRLMFKKALVWLAFPLIYVVYSLGRELVIDWAPYPFLNPDLEHGYSGVAIMSSIIAICLIVLVWLVAYTTKFGKTKATVKKQRRAQSA